MRKEENTYLAPCCLASLLEHYRRCLSLLVSSQGVRKQNLCQNNRRRFPSFSGGQGAELVVL